MKKGNVIQTAFDSYTLFKEVGSGGNGHVYSATNNNGEFVAIKFVEKNIDSKKLKRFKNEIYFCETHKHKNIIKIMDRGYAKIEQKDYIFYVMPIMKETLADKIKAGISPKDAINIFIGIIEGLSYAHKNGAIHRDIKPQNILFAENSLEPVICDFGIAHFAEEELKTAIETKASDRMANFYYAAPEQYKREAVTCPQTDIYAAGLILNEMFTGEIPKAPQYKTIESVDEEYKYLDDLFSQLFIQEASKRLYPEEVIISELKRLSEKYLKEQEKKKLQEIVYEIINPENFEAKIVNIDYKDNYINFIFNQHIPDTWYGILVNGSYMHSSIIGYGPDKVEKYDNNILRIHIRGDEIESTIKSIINYFRDWVEKTNLEYMSFMKRTAYEEQQRKEKERIEKIKQIEKENQIKSAISESIKGMF